MDVYLIDYNLFKSRTGFNPYLLIEKGVDYEGFCAYLRKRRVNPPDKNVFEKYQFNQKKFLVKGSHSAQSEETKEVIQLEEKPKRKRKKRRKTSELDD